MVSRRYQMWEEIYASALHDAEVGTSEDGTWLEERRVFLGATRSKGHALVSPDREKHVAARMQEESSVLKERRKAREERRMLRGEVPPTTGDEAKKPRGRGRGRGGR